MASTQSNCRQGSLQRRLRHMGVLLGALFSLTAFGALAESDHLVRIVPDDFEATLQGLEQAGYDLAGHDRAAGTIEVVVGAEEIDELSAYGQATLLRSSRPYREVAAERAGGAMEDAPDNRYKTYGEVEAALDDAAARFPAIAQKVDLTALLGVPATWDGRHVFAMKISDNVGTEEDEPAVLFDALHHARELNTIEVALDIIDHLTTGYASGDTAPLVDQLAIWVVPAVNPDGLEYVWSNNDMWRKNRRNNGNGSFGVDPNRNYPFKWGVCGSNSGTPSSNTYRGPAAASEPEVQTMVALGQRIRPVFYNSYHSSGREVLPPYVCGTLAETQMVNTIRDRYRNAMNYATRAASSSGESFEWFYNQVSSVGFLTEISTAFQPPFNQTLAEVDRVRPGWLLLLDLVANGSFPLVEGRVSDATTGLPLEAEIESSAVAFAEGERRASEPGFGRYGWFLRSIEQDLTFSAAGYLSRTLPVLPIDGINVVDVALQPEGPPLPSVSVVASDGSASEAGLDGGAYEVSRTGDTTAALTVRYTVSGTATGGSDYQALPGAVTIPAGQASAQVAVTPLDDPDVESDETVSLALSGDAAYEVGSPSNATVTIASDDVGGNLPVVSLSVTRGTAAEAGLLRGRLRLERTGNLSAALTVRYSVGGTATGGSDYRALSGSKTIKAGKSRAWFDIRPIDDPEAEPDETVEVTLSTDAAYEVGSPSSGTVTVTSDDVGGGLPVVSIAVSDATATEAGPTSGAFTVSRTGDSSAALTVSYGTAGTASSGDDYATLSGSVTFTAGATSASISVDPVDDADIEADETVVVSLSAGSAYEVGSPNSGTVTIASDDVGGNLPVVTITLLRDGAEAGRSRGRVRIDRTGALGQALTLGYSVSGTATSGADFKALSGEKRIKSGKDRNWIDIVPVNDTVAEGDESVVLTILPDPAYQVGAAGGVTVNIADNDQRSAAR